MKTTLSKNQPKKSLLKSLKKTGGRNMFGHITAWQRGGGSRKLWRNVSFGQEFLNRKGKVERIEYDPNRNAHIALVSYDNGRSGYVLAPQGIEAGQEILCAEKTDIKGGNRMRLGYIPVGTMVYNIELAPGEGGKMARGAGAGAPILAHEGQYTLLELPSKEVRKVLSSCFASVGMVSNPGHRYERVKNAGAARRKGRRPNVRGTAMNPVDHPHGGGEGKAPVGLKAPKTPWGKKALGVKTRGKKKWSNKLIVRRREKKKKS
ncbi:MAG: 50S ribosomal protein L2 [Candidatus Yanofskybacteria bacterium]|nr:50S ribosomal protein L2 [Candidatus Yanofskybacteria bacterium]